MANGWAKLGEALAGTTPAQRARIEQQTIGALAQRDAAIARAKQEMMQTRELEGLGRSFAELGIENADAAANVARSGINLGLTTKGLGDIQEQRFRQAAVDAPTFGEANRQLMGVASGPVEVPKVAGGVLLGNRLIEGGGTMEVTPVGAAQIAADAARGEAALIRANRPPASRGGGGAGAAPKLSQIDTMRLKADLAPIEAQIKGALDDIQTNAGASSPAARAALKSAQDRLASLQAEQAAIFNRYGSPSVPKPLGERVAPQVDFVIDDPENMPPQVVAGLGDVAARMAAEAAPADQINPRLFDAFQSSLRGTAPAAPPAAPSAAPRRAINPKTGEVIELRNGRWVPVN